MLTFNVEGLLVDHYFTSQYGIGILTSAGGVYHDNHQGQASFKLYLSEAKWRVGFMSKFFARGGYHDAHLLRM